MTVEGLEEKQIQAGKTKYQKIWRNSASHVEQLTKRKISVKRWFKQGAFMNLRIGQIYSMAMKHDLIPVKHLEKYG